MKLGRKWTCMGVLGAMLVSPSVGLADDIDALLCLEQNNYGIAVPIESKLYNDSPTNTDVLLRARTHFHW